MKITDKRKDTHFFFVYIYKYLDIIFIFFINFLIGFLTSPPVVISSYLLWVRNKCPIFLPPQEGPEGIFKLFHTVLFTHSYRLFVFLVCPLVRWFDANVIYHKIIFSLLYGILGITVLFLFKKLTRNQKLSFFSTILTFILPPFVFYSWPIFELSNIMGALCVFWMCIFFFTESRNIPLYILFTLTAFLSGFGSEQSRLYTLPSLFLLFLLYPERRSKNIYLLCISTFFIFLSLLFHTKYARIPGPQLNTPSAFLLAVVYYSHFIFCYYLYCYGYLGISFLTSSFIRFMDKKFRNKILFLFFSLFLLLTLSIPVYPYSEVFLNFFFVTPGLPWQFFALALIFCVSLLYSSVKSKERWEQFSIFNTLSCSLILIFIMGIYPRMRTDPSARHLLVVFPFTSLLLLKIFSDWLKGIDKKYFKYFIIFLFTLTMVRNFSPLYSLISKWHGISSIGYSVHSFLSHKLKRMQKKVCIFYLNPQFYFFFPDDILSSHLKPRARVFRYTKDPNLRQIEEESCKDRKIWGIFFRIKPAMHPLYYPVRERFFTMAHTFSLKGDDPQAEMMELAKMHTSENLALEEKLKKLPLLFRIEGEYFTTPLFLNEFLHRIISHIPFFLSYKFYFEIYDLR